MIDLGDWFEESHAIPGEGAAPFTQADDEAQ